MMEEGNKGWRVYGEVLKGRVEAGFVEGVEEFAGFLEGKVRSDEERSDEL